MIDGALSANAGDAEAHCNRGNALKELQRFADAIASYDTALAFDPGHEYALGAAAECAMRLCNRGWRENHQADLRLRVIEQRAIIAPFVAFCGESPRSFNVEPSSRSSFS